MPNKLITYSDVLVLTGVRSRSTIYDKVRRGEFPAPIKISPRNVRFKESEVLDWIAALPRQEYAS